MDMKNGDAFVWPVSLANQSASGPAPIEAFLDWLVHSKLGRLNLGKGR